MSAVAILRDDYVAALVQPDARRARMLISEALAAGTDPETVYLDVLAPALYEIGLRWERDEIGIAGEHLASSVTESVMAELAGRMRHGSPSRGTAIVACVGEELHRIGSRVVADFLEGAGWDVEHLGAMVPVEQLAVAARGASLVALSITLPSRIPELERACRELKALDPAPFVAVGGQGLAGADVPADLVTNDPRELVRCCESLPAGPGRPAAGDPERPDLYAEETALVQQVLALNDDLVRARREIARHVEILQRNLLPDELPQVDGVRLEARYVPGTENDIGGDWYDAIVLDSGELAVVIGDVAGKGVQAAAHMGEVRSVIRAYLLDDPDPAAVLARADRLVVRAGVMVTAVVGVLDPGTGVWRHARAGHLPPLLMTDGGARFLEGGSGAPLLAHERVEAAVTQLARGDRILLFTDGLVERRDESIEHGLERLRAAATGADLDGLLATAPRGQARDDIALLVTELSR